MAVPIFRVLRHLTMEDILDKASGGIMYKAGKDIGRSLEIENLDDFLDWVEHSGIGIPEVDTSEKNKTIVRIYECVTCAGIPNIGRPVCHFEGGLISGFLEKIDRKRYIAKEVKCWGLGYDVCEFEIIELKM